MALYLMQYPDADRFDTSSLETVLLSASPVPLELKEGFANRFDCEVIEAYGLTEASPAIAVERRGEKKRAGSCGKPLDGVDVGILDEGGRVLPTGEVGEICARSPGIMKGYFGMPEASAEALRDGWLHTGDMGYLDGDGYLYVTDRRKDLIIRGGFNVYPRDVEDVLYQHPGVLEAAVVGKPDAAFGEEVVAFVVPAPGLTPTEDDLLAFCRERLAKYKRRKRSASSGTSRNRL
jgi:long-chain acyl-CoA synthetase